MLQSSSSDVFVAFDTEPEYRIENANKRNQCICSHISNKMTESKRFWILMRSAPPGDGHVAEENIIAIEYGDIIKPPADAISGRKKSENPWESSYQYMECTGSRILVHLASCTISHTALVFDSRCHCLNCEFAAGTGRHASVDSSETHIRVFGSKKVLSGASRHAAGRECSEVVAVCEKQSSVIIRL